MSLFTNHVPPLWTTTTRCGAHQRFPVTAICGGRGSGCALVSRRRRGSGRLFRSGGWRLNLFRSLAPEPTAIPTDYDQQDHNGDGAQDRISVLHEFVHSILTCSGCCADGYIYGDQEIRLQRDPTER